MNKAEIKLSQLRKWTDVPKIVNDLADETWFVTQNNSPIGVGLFKKNSDQCIVAIVGEHEEDRVVLGNGSSPENAEDELVLHGLEIAFFAYLRSIKGDDAHSID